MVLETAVVGGADAIVTFNIKDFLPASRFQLPVLTLSSAWATSLLGCIFSFKFERAGDA